MTWISQPSRGYWVSYLPEDKPNDPEYRHLFCGPHNVSGAWCAICQKPFLRYLSLDTSDPSLGLHNMAVCSLPLFYCWTCQSGSLQYRLAGPNAIEIIYHDTDGLALGFPYADYPDFFPEATVTLSDLTKEEQQVLRDINADLRPNHDYWKGSKPLGICRHQVGGEPYLVQLDTEYEMLCPGCGKHMPFLYAAGDDCLDPRGFVDNQFVQVIFHLCRACGIVSCFNQCD